MGEGGVGTQQPLQSGQGPTRKKALLTISLPSPAQPRPRPIEM